MAAQASPAPDGTLGWRKRHPVLARVLLYGLGLALAGAGVWFWRCRCEQDDADRVKYLWARLETLPVVLQADPDGAEAGRVLDAEFSDPDLPDDLEARAQRLRGIVARLRGDARAMDAAFFRARNLDVSAQAVEAVTLEWAQCRIDVKDLDGARQLLMAPPPQHPVLGLWRPVIQAHLLEAAGKGEEGRIHLVTLIDKLPKPLPRVPTAWFLLNEWRFEDVLVEAVRWLVAGLPEGSPQGASLWQRVPEFSPQDVRSLVAAAEGVLAAGDKIGARGLWARARKADPVFVAKISAQRPMLSELDAP